MELVNFKHSTKDIPVPSFKVYMNMFINIIKTFVRKVELSAEHFLNPTRNTHKETYGFPSLHYPEPVNEITPFKEDLLNLAKNIEFRRNRSEFQTQLKTEVNTIKNVDKIIVAADKTSNHYKMTPEHYLELTGREVRKDYKKADDNHVKNINKAHKKIVAKLDIQDRVFRNTESEAFITLKDHKGDFKNNPKCRLLNPAKPQVGRVSHKVLKHVVNVIRQRTQLNHWENTYACIEWYKKIQNKDKHAFLVFDIVSFYPSITLNLLNKALDWASQYVTIAPHCDIKL